MDMLIVAIPLIVLIAIIAWLFHRNKQDTIVTQIQTAPVIKAALEQSEAANLLEETSGLSSNSESEILDAKNDDAEDSDSEAVEHLLKLLPPRFMILDLETTGLSSYVHEIIEIGAIDVVLGRKVCPAFNTLVRPENKISRKITGLTGITQEMVANEGVSLAEAFAKLLVFLEDVPIVTYNASFDMGFLYQAAQRFGHRLPNRYCCALKTARRGFPDLSSYRLSYLSELFKLDTSNGHRAVADCGRTLTIFSAATRRIDNKARWSLPPEHMRLEKRSRKPKSEVVVGLSTTDFLEHQSPAEH